MLRVVKICRNCGAQIFSDAPEGLCTGCVLESAIRDAADIEENGNAEATGVTEGIKGAKAELLGEIGDYELLEEVGRGAQGVVFRARQKSLNRKVALKVIRLGQWASKADLKRFRREAEAAAGLDHPGIVPIYEVGEHEGSCYFSMKFVEGGQLDKVVKREPLAIRQAAELVAKVARTVHYAHEHGILHRDIKPGNVLLDARGEPHLTDFGLARLIESDSTVTRTLEVMGTPSYMAPEQALGNHAAVAQPTDVYGLGAVLYQLLTGHPPFAGGTTYETIKLVLETEPAPPRLWNRKIDRDLSTICLHCLEKDPQRRFQSALELAEDLDRWLKHEPIRARRTGIFARSKKWVQRNLTAALLVATLAALVTVVGWNVWKSDLIRSPVTTGIAVLPFDNLSEQTGNDAFVDGVQDDILTKLARIANLKVISRTSVMEYRGKRNVREVGDALRVSHVLEGTVRRSGNRLRVNAQLIDARTDTHVWAEQYDRDLNDLFAIQSEIALRVAQQLNTKISPAERLTIERRPTGDLVAFDLYSRAHGLLFGPTNGLEEVGRAIDLLNGAVAHDPSFFDAYCQLAFAHDVLYFSEIDHTSGRLALAEAAIREAFRIRPDAGEAHLGQALHLYQGYKDYDGALAELEIARQTLPNNARVFETMGRIQKRQGRWEESQRNYERAAELDPRDVAALATLADIHQKFGRYAESKQWLKRAVVVAEPNDVRMKLQLPMWDLEVSGDPGPLHQTINSLRATNPAVTRTVNDIWFECTLSDRDVAAAAAALTALDGNQINLVDEVRFNRAFVEGVIARLANDEPKAQLAFAAARAEQEEIVQSRPDFGPAWSVLGMIDAGLGRKGDAVREGRRAIELLPVERDALVGRYLVRYLAMIAAWVGEKDLACQQLTTLLGPPCFLDYGTLKLSPLWDPLRGEPCFEKIVDSLAPKAKNVTR
jgi:serine/threonine-protein kinase